MHRWLWFVMKIIQGIFIFFIFFLLTTSVVCAKTTLEWIDEGIQLSNEGKYEEAIEAYDKAIEINPQDTNAWYNKGNDLCNLGKYEEALNAYDKVIEINPQDVDAWNNKGATFADLNKHIEALECFDKLLEINPQDVKALGNKGIILADLNRHIEALECFDKLLEINPQDVKALGNKGIILADLNRHIEALECFDKLLEINPQNTDAWNNKGASLDDLNRYEEAIYAYDKAIKINPQYVKAWVNKANTLLTLSRHEEAINACNRAINISPQYVNAFATKGATLSDLGRHEEAIKCFDKVIELNPQDADTWYNKGITLSNLGRHEEAIKCFNIVIELNPQDADAWDIKELILRDLGMHEEVKISTDIRLEPKTGEIINQLELSIEALINPDDIYIKPEAIQLNYSSDNSLTTETFNLYNNLSYIGKLIKVDLNQRNDYPFEDYNSTIIINSLDKNLTNTQFFINTPNRNLTINSWGQPYVINFIYEGNKIEITMERANKKITGWLYWIGVVIISTYLILFLIIYKNSPYNSDMFAVFNSFSFLFFVALVVAGVKDYIFISIWATGFFGLALICFGCILIKRLKSRAENSRLKREEEMYKIEMKEMLKQNNEKINELKEILKIKFKQKDENQLPK